MLLKAGYNINDFSDGLHVATAERKDSIAWDWGWRSRILTVKLLDNGTRFVATDVHVFDGYRMGKSYDNDVDEAMVLTGTVTKYSGGIYILNPEKKIVQNMTANQK